MKKKLFVLCLSVFVFASAFALQYGSANDSITENAFILVKDGEGISGKCQGDDNKCMWKCPKCHATYEANASGTGYDITGVCIACGYVVP